MFKYIAILTFIFFANVAAAQVNFNVKVKVQNADSVLQNINVLLFTQNDTFAKSTNTKGEVFFKGINAFNFTIQIVQEGFKTYTKQFTNASGENFELPTIQLIEIKELKAATVVAKQDVKINGDTVSYDADRYNVKSDLPSEELLKKLPGVTVDKEGNVTAQGKQVTKVRVNGKDFFGGDVKTATKEIPVEMIDKVQVVDDYGDQANFTGVREGDAEKVLNYVLKKDKNQGVFGNLTAGYGTQDRYIGSATIHRFKDEEQLSLMLNSNNTNSGLFNFSSPGGGGRGMMRGGNKGGSNDAGSVNQMGQIMNSGDFGFVQTGNSNNDGVSTTNSIGLNYRNQITNKIQLYGSYVFTNRNTNTITENAQQNIFSDYNTFYNQNQESNTNGNNHRVYMNIEYKIDSNNYIKFSPQFSYRNSESDANSDFGLTNDTSGLVNKGFTTYLGSTSSPYYSGTILWNHKFAKKGRTFSAELNGGNTITKQTENNSNISNVYTLLDTFETKLIQKVDTRNETMNFNTKFSYTEPLSIKTNLEINYRYGNDYTAHDRGNFVLNNSTNNYEYVDSLSNSFNNEYITHRLAANLRVTETKYNYSVGMAVQPANISTINFTIDKTISQNIFNYFPVARFNYKFSRNKSLEINYNGRTNQPSAMQLQPVTDFTNRQFLVTGNSFLRPEFNSTVRLRYNNFNIKTGVSLFGHLNFGFTNDKIVNNTINRGFGVQETQYLNTNGARNISSHLSFSKQFKDKKYAIRLNGSYNLNRNISFIDSVKNVGNNFVLSQGLSFDIRPKDWIDLSIGGNYNLNFNKYSLGEIGESQTENYVLNSDATFFLPKNFRINYSLNKNFNSGFAGNVSSNPFIINTYIEKRFLKNEKAALRLSGFDLLNQNTNISRTINANSILDSRNNRLNRYFMLSFIYKLNKFTGKLPEQKMPEGHMSPSHMIR